MPKVAASPRGGDEGVDREELLEQLRLEHRELESRLAELERHLSLTPAEQLERARIKKLKLVTKDRIQSLQRAAHA